MKDKIKYNDRSFGIFRNKFTYFKLICEAEPQVRKFNQVLKQIHTFKIA